MSLLTIKDLSISFPHKEDRFYAVQNLSLTINKGETHCLVGESGCGKSVSAFAIMGLLQKPGSIDSGSIIFEGDELLEKEEAKLQKIRGNRIAMIFQDPMTSLNPVYRCGEQVAEAIRLHQGKDRESALRAAEELFIQVKIPDPKKRLRQYPHELSGGMRQRVMIAMALACKPTLLIADEPTTALDVTVQAQILALLKELQKTYEMAILFITHDLGVVAQIADTVTVLYAGSVVERATARELFQHPQHPYTNGLIGALPSLTRKLASLVTITGSVPGPGESVSGCIFHPRCPKAQLECQENKPELSQDIHAVSCYFPQDEVH